MKHNGMVYAQKPWPTRFPLWLLLSFTLAISGLAQPIQLHPNNPHYLLWRGKPTILITSGEHYGAIINRDFDYNRYLDELKKHEFNLTRAFSGSYLELTNTFPIVGNTLAPARGRFVCPWARSATPGAFDGGNKFDLTRWDEEYFARLQDFVTKAADRGVVVELVFFCTMYNDALWSASPMNQQNNVNGIGRASRGGIYSGTERGLLDAQRAMVRKLVTELNRFDNVYFEICNEPYERAGLMKEWNDLMIETVAETEAGLPKRHLIAQNFPPSTNTLSGVNRRVSVINFHAATPRTVQANYSLNRVISFDETGGAERSDRHYRTQGWEFILSGGGVFDHLDFSFTTDRPDGTAVPLPAITPGGGGLELRRQLAILKKFIEELDFIRMTPDTNTIKSHRAMGTGRENKVAIAGLSERGKAYAFHLRGGGRTELTLGLPAGRYQADWLNTKTGQVEASEAFSQGNAERVLLSPAYTEDIALQLLRKVE